MASDYFLILSTPQRRTSLPARQLPGASRLWERYSAFAVDKVMRLRVSAD